MDKFLRIVRRKNSFYYYASFAYLAAVILLKWTIHPAIEILWFVAGGVIGIFFLDFAEEFFHLSPSPFRSILFCGGFVIVALFVVSSSGSLLASGLVLTVYLTLLLWQIGEWRSAKNLHAWYQILSQPVTVSVQYRILNVFALVFLLLTVLFIRS
jgi:hypothetical protein